MAKRIVRTSNSRNRVRDGKHRFEHWQVDNQVYFITARCQQRFPAFADEHAKSVFWDRFEYYTARHGFTPWVTSLLDNHYHTIGFLKAGNELPGMMQRVHGSVAKLVNDHLRAQGAPAPWLDPRAEARSAEKFWGDKTGHEYFDGCLRDIKQGRLTYRYVLSQCKRHGICDDYKDYKHTRINIEVERAIKRAIQLNAFLTGVPYKRYQTPKN